VTPRLNDFFDMRAGGFRVRADDRAIRVVFADGVNRLAGLAFAYVLRALWRGPIKLRRCP
jgi:hypothetical protein